MNGIEAKNKKGNTALHLALQIQSEMFANYFLKNGADVNIATENGSTSLHLAILWQDCPDNLLQQILKSTKDIQAKNSDGKTALHCALESQSTIACKMLLRESCVAACCVAAGIDVKTLVNASTEEKVTVLHLAAKWSNIEDELFKKIRKNTTDINQMDKKGRTPLYYALMFKSVTATNQLLGKKATVDAVAQKFNGYTALHLAAFWSNIPLETFEKILEKEKDKINVKDKFGRTALHRAIESKSVFIIKKLLDSLDSIDSIDSIADVDNLTPLHLAAQWKLKYSLVPESQRNPNQSYVQMSDYKLDESISDITPSLFKKILDKSSGTINAQSSRRLTALHLALYSHSITATDALLKHPELKVNIKDNEGEMAIHLAAKWKHIDVEAFEIILKNTHEDNLNQRHYCKTALHYAQESGSPPEIINLLQKAIDQQHVVTATAP